MTDAELHFLQTQFAARVALCKEPSALIAGGIDHDVAVCLCGLDLLSRLSGGAFITQLARGGVQYDSSVSIEAWDDDTDDKYGWHDPYFGGYRVTIFPGMALPINEHVNQYGVRTAACIGFLSSRNIGSVVAALHLTAVPAPVIAFFSERVGRMNRPGADAPPHKDDRP